MTTIRDVAKLAGVSIATVSRASNEPELVSTEVRSKIEKAIAATGYVKSVKPRRKSDLFGIILPNLSNPFFLNLLEALEYEARTHRKSIVLFNSRQKLVMERAAFAQCRKMKVDGVFLVPHSVSREYIAEIRRYDFPTVLLTRTSSLLPSVAVDHVEGGRQVAEHVISSGHVNVAYVGPTKSSEEKLVGFLQGLQQAGLQLRADLAFDTEGEGDLRRFAIDTARRKRASVIFCVNDVLAQEIITILRAAEMNVPQDMEIVGFDNSIVASLLDISSVSQPMKEIAHVGFEAMLLALKSERPSEIYEPHQLLPRLVMRGSSLNLRK
jgi:LacI family transcriptional regulator